MLIVKNTNVLEDYGFKREKKLSKDMWSFYYKAGNFFLWVNPYLDVFNKRNKNQLVLEYFNEDIDCEDLCQEYMPQKIMNVIYRLINDDIVYIEFEGVSDEGGNLL